MSIPVPEKYVADFEKLGFGMFVHWGIYSQLGKGEWVFDNEKLDMNEYKKLADTFTAEDFDAEELVLTAKSAGCKYITLTTRHHDGFSLYDTCGLNDFDAPHSGAKRDLIKEFVDACRKHDIVPFFYHTTLDWYNKDFENDFDAYLEYLRKSVEILCKNYGKIGGLWFDGNWSKEDADWKESELYATIRKYQPEAIIVNNTGLDERGKTGNIEIDSVTYERGRPEPMDRDGMPKYLAAEMCETINNHWGFANFDLDYKSPQNLIESLCMCRKVGANLLLNIGPTAQGGVDPYQRELMKLIGKWTDVYGEAIYEGKPCGVNGFDKDFALKGDGCMYFFFFNLSEYGSAHAVIDEKRCDSYIFTGVKDEIESIEWMDNNKKFDFTQDGDTLTIGKELCPYGLTPCVRVAKAILK